MAKEIERKFLVKSDLYKSMANSVIEIKQGYLSLRKEATVRVRLKGECAYLTIKGISHGATRDEWEYQIPVADALSMLESCCEGKIISKTQIFVNSKSNKKESYQL